MKKQIIFIMLAAMALLVWAGAAAAELSTEDFIKQFIDALQKKDTEKIGKIVMQNPEAAKQAQQVLKKAGEGKDDNAKTAKAIGEVLAQVLQIIQKEGADDPATAEMDRLQEEGEKAFYAANYPQAIAKWEKGLELAKKAENKKYTSQFLGNIGVVYDDLGQYEKALSYYEQALAIKKEIRDRRGEAGNLANIGVVFKNLGQYEKALSYYEQALAIHKEIGDRSGEGSDLLNMGVAYSYLEKYGKAVPVLSESIKICSEIGAIDTLWKAQRGIAEAQGKLKKYDEAVTHYEQSLDTIEEVREGISEKESRTSFMRGRLYVYDEYITLLQDLHKQAPKKGYDKRSLEIFERKQGRVFLEQMGESGARNYKEYPDDMRNKETELANQLEKNRAALGAERSKPFEQQNKERIRELEAEKDSIEKAQTALQAEIQKKYPDYYALRYPKPVALDDIQKKVLQAGEIMLIYNVMKDRTSLWVVGKNQLGFFPLDIGEKALEEKVNAFRNEPTVIIRTMKYARNQLEKEVDFSLKEMSRMGKDLYALLIPEKARSLISDAKLLYVIPTASLYGLPFEALISQHKDGQARYLLEDHAMAYLSSASLLKILQDAQSRRKESPANPLLAFAHPKYGTEKGTGKRGCFTKGEEAADASLEQIRVRGYLDLMGGSLCELPETENEVRNIRALLNAPETALQLREKASESNVFAFHQDKKLDDYRYVVFSCHGLLPGAEKTTRVNQPALALSVPDPSDTNQDGFLTMAEVFGLALNADLVVLSACDTGRGDHIRGEGVRGLTRAFMYAGTPAVSVTLWPVADKSSSVLSRGFFENLEGKNAEKKKLPLGESLRQIKLDMMHGEHGKLYRHPYFWAPAVVFGIGEN